MAWPKVTGRLSVSVRSPVREISRVVLVQTWVSRCSKAVSPAGTSTTVGCGMNPKSTFTRPAMEPVLVRLTVTLKGSLPTTAGAEAEATMAGWATATSCCTLRPSVLAAKVVVPTLPGALAVTVKA